MNYTDSVEMASSKSLRPGRPKLRIRAAQPDVKKFFRICDELGLSLQEVQDALKDHIAHPPSYRTLQEWRRGTHTPKFAPFSHWIDLLRHGKAATKIS